jgi:diacylglycerol kinase (ATP)
VRVAIVYNPVSGSGRARAVAARLEGELRAGRVESVLVETRPSAASEWLGQALDGVDAVVVAGGDGAVRLVAPVASARAVPIWHAPSGTENLFARAFGMSASGAAIAASLTARRTRDIDLANANGEPFALMASVGFDADVVHDLASVRRGGITHLSYVAPILRTVRSWRPTALAWTIDGEREELGEGMVVIGNLPDYGMRLNPAAGACPDDALLDAVFLPAGSSLELAAWVPFLRTGLHRTRPGLRERRGSVVELHCARRCRVQLDGDAALGLDGVGHLRATVASAALKILLPT